MASFAHIAALPGINGRLLCDAEGEWCMCPCVCGCHIVCECFQREFNLI